MNAIRAKFKVDAISTPPSPEMGAGTVYLSAVISDDPTHENKIFTDLTPAGNLMIGITKPETLAFYEVGKEYYLDFTKAE